MMQHLNQSNHSRQKSQNVRLTLIYDSISIVPGLKTGRGFSCVVQVGDMNLLFDTGSDGEILLSNMRKLGIDPQAIQIVLISHNRAGHVGGLNNFLRINSQVTVYIPEVFPEQIIESIGMYGIKTIIVSDFREIQSGMFALSAFTGFFREQALAFKSAKGVVVVTGCAHHGIIPILKKAEDVLSGEPIYLALGGFHFYGVTDPKKLIVFEAFKMLKVQKVAPCHCCEEDCRLRFKKVYGNNYIEMGVGKTIQIGSNS
ncbi:MAG: MBL fold metallo-hydrolase [Calditrichota bacterium]